MPPGIGYPAKGKGAKGAMRDMREGFKERETKRGKKKPTKKERPVGKRRQGK